MTAETSWEEVNLEDYVDLVAGYPFKSAGYTDDQNDVRLLRGDNVAQGELRWDKAKRWPVADYQRYDAFHLREGDIILAMDRPWISAGLKYARIKRSDTPALLVQRVARLRGAKTLQTDYLRCIIGSPGFTDYVLSILTGVNVPHISARDIKRFRFLLPPVAVQKKISIVITSYDDLIENNTRRIEILEEMARRLYEEWFVQFRFPGHEEVEFKESELGLIPEGWGVVKLEEVCDLITDGAHKSPPTAETGMPMASVKDMHDWGVDVSKCRRISQSDYDELVRNNCKPMVGDILVAKDGSYLKHIFSVEKDQDLVLLSSIAILRPANKSVSDLLVCLLRHPETIARMKGCVSGVAIPRIILKDFRKFQIVLPDQGLQEAWLAIASPLMRLCRKLVEKNTNLRAQRDLLLPKLISGEIDVSDIPMPT
ncbi:MULTISPECIES: restriction endonuclease subunit S [Pseudomonas]|uniref:Restriction endonuclease subunit S n=1 Tax=Pseudomonas triclosanedens TaxID=2961893 RepID=A0ABY6ZSK4_9PSED|nr:MULTISPECIES: restriction endonuclease subunit S [Pseudomonas]MCP8467210.1 restriction endonuclease subunit S [Pseudomonas triclosanedens]MCP8472537.1 restriction endonuclease subunit S [Pseudomonas triclosanedens]MCP8478598.1 restriction endonuclease subunit S [Pseudomonas triclosanedens]WAI47774.1 restriction endonuclease subunit S [Pseudomonas triclosanedens]